MFFLRVVWLSNFCRSFSFQLSNEKKSGCLGYIGDAILPSYVGITISRYRDPYEPTRIQWNVSKYPRLFVSWLNRIKESILCFSGAGHIVVTEGCSLTEWETFWPGLTGAVHHQDMTMTLSILFSPYKVEC